MDRRNLMLGLLAFPVLSGCDQYGEVHPVRLKLELSAKIGGVARTASTVFESQYINNGKYGTAFGGQYSFRRVGDALMMNLGDRGVLYGIWDELHPGEGANFNGTQSQVLPTILPLKERLNAPNSEYETGKIFQRLQKYTAPVPLRRSDWPVLVYFPQPADIKTARIVKPEELSAIFGEGSRVDSVSLQITNEEISRGIEKKIPWWNELETFEGPPNRPEPLPVYRELKKQHFTS